MKTGLILLLAVIVLILGSRFISTRQRLVAERQDIEAAWMRVDAALGTRAAAISDLLQFMARGAPRETAAVQTLTTAHAALAAARGPQQKMQANVQLDYALAKLLLIGENYPNLETGKQFSKIEDALKDAEYRIAVERRKYNEAVEHYNTEIALFPNNLVAAISRFRKIDAYFQTPIEPPH